MTITKADLERDIVRAENAMLKARCEEHQIAAQEAGQRAADLARRLAVVEKEREEMRGGLIRCAYGDHGEPLHYARALAELGPLRKLRAAVAAYDIRNSARNWEEVDMALIDTLPDEDKPATPPAPRVIAPGDVGEQVMPRVGGKPVRCEGCRANVFTRLSDSKLQCNGCSETYTVVTQPAPVASPAPAPDGPDGPVGLLEACEADAKKMAAREAATQSVRSLPYCDVRGRSEHGLAVEVCRNCYDLARDPPPGVLATPNATDEERARAWLDDMLRAHGREKPAHVLLELPHLLATIRTERDAAHRAEVAGSE